MSGYSGFSGASGYSGFSGIPGSPPTIKDDEGTFTIPTTGYLYNRQRLTLTVSERATVEGTGRAQLSANDQPFRGAYASTSFTLLPDTYVLQYKNLSLNGNVRVTLLGNAEIILTNFTPGSRLVLSGRGG